MTLLYDTQSLLERNLTKLIRNPTLFGTLLAEPLILFLVFGAVFQNFSVFIPGTNGGYLAYLMPGMLIMGAAVSSSQSGVSIVNDLNSGFLSKMLLTPAVRPAILLGRLLTDMLMVVAQSAIMIVAAIALGVRVSAGLSGVVLMLLTVAFFELALSGIFLAVGMATRKAETVTSISGFLFLPLLFLSSALFPLSFLPSWARTIANYNPVSYVVDVVRELVVGGFSLSTLVSAYALVRVIVVVTIGATLYQFRKVIS